MHPIVSTSTIAKSMTYGSFRYSVLPPSSSRRRGAAMDLPPR